jgi:hypothetical protein
MAIALRDGPLHITFDEKISILLPNTNEGVLFMLVESYFAFHFKFNFNIDLLKVKGK